MAFESNFGVSLSIQELDLSYNKVAVSSVALKSLNLIIVCSLMKSHLPHL